MSQNKHPSALTDYSARTWVAGEDATSSKFQGEFDSISTKIQDLNDSIVDVNNHHAGTSAPSSTAEGQLFCNTSTDPATLYFDGDGNGADSEVFHETRWPAFEVTLSGNQIINTTDPTKIQWDTETFDTNSDFDPTTNYRFTPTAAGKYLLMCQVTLVNYTADENYSLHLYKNGSSFREARFSPTKISNDGVCATWIVDANGSTDYFEIFSDSVADDAYRVDASGTSAISWFAGSRIA